MPLLSQEQKHQVLVQLRRDVSTRKVAAWVGMSQYSVAHLRKDVGGEIERQRGGCPKLLADREKRLCVTLVTKGWLGTAFATTRHLWIEIGKIVVWYHCEACFDVWIGALVQQRKSFMSYKHILARMRFAQRFENWTVDDWKRVTFSDEAKLNRFNSYGRSWS